MTNPKLFVFKACLSPSVTCIGITAPDGAWPTCLVSPPSLGNRGNYMQSAFGHYGTSSSITSTHPACSSSSAV